LKQYNKHVGTGSDYSRPSWRIPREHLEQKTTTCYGASFCSLWL